MTRKAKYPYWLSEGGISQIQDWLDEGLHHHEIAKLMDIHRVTLYYWAKNNQELYNILYADRIKLIESSTLDDNDLLKLYT